jgi:ribose transport system ATP-binding protein
MMEIGEETYKELFCIKGVTKYFPGVKALDDVELELRKGEIHGLVGENGAGKTTLLNIINGIFEADQGKFIFKGNDVRIRSPEDAMRIGIALAHQHPKIFPNLTVAENILINKEPTMKLLGINFVAKDKLYERVKHLLKSINVNIELEAKGSDLGLAKQKFVEIVRAISIDPIILCLDEPTSAMCPSEVERVFNIVRNLKERGRTIVYVTHRMHEIFEICDRITVLRDGKKIGTVNVSDVSVDDIVKMMSGKTITRTYEEVRPKTSKILTVNNLSTRAESFEETPLHNISFHAYEGEIVAFVGLAGAGKTELARALLGLGKVIEGEIYVEGERVETNRLKEMLDKGFSYLSEKLDETLIQKESVRENLTLLILERISKLGFVRKKQEKELAKSTIEKMKIKPPNSELKVSNLSGGNKKKVSIGRGLVAKPKFLVCDELTMGVDVEGKEELKRKIQELAKGGMTVLLFTSEIEDALHLANRIYVMYEGRITAELERRDATEGKILTYMTGLSQLSL